MENLINFTKNVEKKLVTFRLEDCKTDVIITVNDDWKYEVHRKILCKSKAFQALIDLHGKGGFSPCKVQLQENPWSQDAFIYFMKYMYFGYINLTFDLLMGTVTLSGKYEIEELLKICQSYAKENIHTLIADSSQLLNLMLYFKTYPFFIPLYKEFKLFAVRNFKEVFTNGRFVPFELLLDILDSREICVENEFELYKFVEQWFLQFQFNINVNNKEDKEEMFPIVTQVLDRIKFHFLSPEQIECVLKSQVFENFGSVIVSKIGFAARIKAGMTNAGTSFYDPRCYFGDGWGVTVKCYDNGSLRMADGSGRYSNDYLCRAEFKTTHGNKFPTSDLNWAIRPDLRKNKTRNELTPWALKLTLLKSPEISVSKIVKILKIKSFMKRKYVSDILSVRCEFPRDNDKKILVFEGCQIEEYFMKSTYFVISLIIENAN